jgi:membrane-associated phospholipid phosphatase
MAERLGASQSIRSWAARLVLRLRIEEVIALVFLIPTTYLTIAAQAYAERIGELGNRYPGGVVRLSFAVAFLIMLALALKLWPRSAWVRGLREILPFLVCILIYTNLHDTIGFVNPHDIHPLLAAWDRELFGVIPCVWAERFITPARTEVMAFFYGNFFWIAPAVPIVLFVRRRWQAFRASIIGILVCFYMGYFLYVIFPAAPPRLYLAQVFTKNLRGYPNMLFSLSNDAIALLPVDSRAAFPSLHAAITLLALIFAWRYTRAVFWLLLPLVVGLWVSTVYLRHHYVVDLAAGFLLVPLALWSAPRLDAWWCRHQRAAGCSVPFGYE